MFVQCSQRLDENCRSNEAKCEGQFLLAQKKSHYLHTICYCMSTCVVMYCTDNSSAQIKEGGLWKNALFQWGRQWWLTSVQYCTICTSTVNDVTHSTTTGGGYGSVSPVTNWSICSYNTSNLLLTWQWIVTVHTTSHMNGMVWPMEWQQCGRRGEEQRQVPNKLYIYTSKSSECPTHGMFKQQPKNTDEQTSFYTYILKWLVIPNPHILMHLNVWILNYISVLSVGMVTLLKFLCNTWILLTLIQSPCQRKTCYSVILEDKCYVWGYAVAYSISYVLLLGPIYMKAYADSPFFVISESSTGGKWEQWNRLATRE